jgi:hypothetical protein
MKVGGKLKSQLLRVRPSHRKSIGRLHWTILGNPRWLAARPTLQSVGQRHVPITGTLLRRTLAAATGF